MKKLLMLFFLLAFGRNLYSQNGYKFLDIAGGAMVQNQIVGEVSYEWMGKYHTGHELFSEYSVSRNNKIENILFGYAYKPLIAKSKNTTLNFRFTGSIGTDYMQFIGGVSGGFELNFALPNSMVLAIRQKNQIVFFDKNPWRTGLLICLKFPLGGK